MTTTRRYRRGGSPVRKLAKTVGYVLGSVLVFLSAAMAIAALVSLVTGEISVSVKIFLAALATAAAGLLTRWVVPKPKSLTIKESFATVGMSWFVISIFGALPFLFTGTIPSLTGAVFESTSGFTTTGFSVVIDPAGLPSGILFWRALTQWLGGMGVIVLGVIILPFLGTGGAQLAQAESSGHTVERLAPRFQNTAKRLLGVYVAITGLEVVLLWIGDMNGFQALLHSFATVATGGFGTEANSISGFSPYTQWVITFFMVAAGVSFALHFRAWTKPSEYAKNSEFRLYALILLVACAVVVGGLIKDLDAEASIRLGVFNTVSIATGTGFTTADIGLWRPALQIVLIGLMFLGGMAGSTSGAIKTFRIGVLAKAAFADLRRIVRPRGVFVTRFGKGVIPPEVIEAVQSFFLFYMLIFMTSTFLLTFIDANISEGLDLVTATSAVASSMGNVGAGLGQVGPSGTFAAIPDLGKWLLSGLMIVGRLEIFPVLVLFTKDLWRR